MLKRLLHNWPLKLLSVVLALIVWFIIISLADPSDIRTIYNIPIQLLNEDLLTQAGKSYSVEGGDNPTVNIRVSGASSLVRELKASEFTATADIREMIDVNGAVPIKVSSSNPLVNDNQITPASNSVRILYEDIRSKDFLVTSATQDSAPEGYFVGNLSASPRSVKVTAPVSVLDRIGSVQAVVSVSELTESARLESVLQYYTNTGELLSLDSFKDTRTSTDSVMINVEIQTMKTVPLVISENAVDEMKSQLPEGYRYTGHSKLPDVQVVGLKSRLAELTSISIPAGRLNLEGVTEDKTFELDLEYFLPEGISLMNGQENLVSLTINVDALVVREFSLRNVRLIGEASGFRYEFDNSVTVQIRALEEDFNGFDPATISLTIDVTEYATNPGQYSLPLQVHTEDETIFAPLEGPRIDMTIKAETPPTRERETTAPTTQAPTTEAPSASSETTKAP